MKNFLRGKKGYRVTRDIYAILCQHFWNGICQKVVSLTPSGACRGRALLSYVIEPFVSNSAPSLLRSHTRFAEASEMAKALLDFDYIVDIIDYRNQDFVPRQRYDLFIDTRFNFNRLAPLLPENCVKILHAETAHPLFQSAAQAQRLLDLHQRRGVILPSYRHESPTKATELADFITIYGNEAFTLNTYSQVNKPVRCLPVSSTQTYPWWENKDHDTYRNRFLWFGSHDLVHKGLDLVLEAFAQMPDYDLTVCGPVKNEPEFEQAFYRELYETPNICTVGWIDTSSEAFHEILQSCAAFVFASCSEGQASSVVECMHAGLIPIISSQSGVNVCDFGVVLQNSSIEEIKSTVQHLAQLPAEELRCRAYQAWEYAQANHTLNTFGQAYRDFLSDIHCDWPGRTI